MGGNLAVGEPGYKGGVGRGPAALVARRKSFADKANEFRRVFVSVTQNEEGFRLEPVEGTVLSRGREIEI